MTKSLNCDNCGIQLNTGSSFCGSCGASVPGDQDTEGHDGDRSARPYRASYQGQQPGSARMTTLRRVGVMSVGKFSMVMCGFIGVLIGVIYFLVLLFVTDFIWALLALFGSVIGYGLIGFLGGLLYAWLYNVVAGIIGGIELELE